MTVAPELLEDIRALGSMLEEQATSEKWSQNMAANQIDIEMQDTGEFLAQIHTATGIDELVLALGDAEAISDGDLADDEDTARATVVFLLELQDSSDLPDRLDLTDIDAAYEGAVESIKKHRQT